MNGKLYLGKEFDVNRVTILPRAYYYKPSNLTTHAVVFGMTGSGKTGLCIDLLEELILEDVGITVIDPKGDVSNLALLFPELAPEDFLPWICEAEARQKGMSREEYANEMAIKWKDGLFQWGLDQEKIALLKEKAEIRIFTPGSSAGLKVNITRSLRKPEADFEEDEELLLEKIKATVSSLLTLLGLDPDPLRSKPHIFLSSIIEFYWRLGRDITLQQLITAIQKPPIRRLGVFDVDTIMDENDRAELAFSLNNLIASPTFKLWTQGFPLSAEELYSKKSGRVPVNIFYIAHLSENERMFFVSLLLNEILAWLRTLEGTSQLKHVLYIDEVYGYMPPYPANPPSKAPLLTLLKQARAFGMGVVLVTQNPKDIDYKGLSNAGTWFIGKLQSHHDRERVLEGLKDGVTQSVNMEDLEILISKLDKRVFLAHNVHEDRPRVFYTRWAMSYLAGPLSREQIKRLVKEQSRVVSMHVPEAKKASLELFPEFEHLLPFPPMLPAGLKPLYEKSNFQRFAYRPYFYLEANVVFDDMKIGLYVRKDYKAALDLTGELDWAKADFFETEPEWSYQPDDRTGGYEPIPFKLDYKTISRLQAAFKDYLRLSRSLKLFYNPDLKLFSSPDEREESFRLRCRDVVERIIDKEVEKLKSKYEKRIQRLEEKLEKEREKIEILETELQGLKTEEIISAGETILGLILGSRSRRGLSTAARKRRMVRTKKARIAAEKAKEAALLEQIEELKEELEDAVADIEDLFYEKADKIEVYEVRLEKRDIVIENTSLLWRPVPLETKK